MTRLESEIPAPEIPAQAEVRYQMEVAFRWCNITPFVARQNANVYLLNNVGNMLSAGEPTLHLSDQPHWKVPIPCAFPEFDHQENLGVLAVDVNSGAILLEHSHPSSPQEIERHAENAYHQLATSSSEA